MAKIFITGSTDGLGQLAAKSLVESGHDVVLHARSEERANTALRDLPDASGVVIGNLADMEETKQLAQKVNKLGTFDAVIHNAGVFKVPHDAKSKDGLPLVFAVNSIATYLLTVLINKPERLIYLSSNMHRQGDAGEAQLDAVLRGKNVSSYSDTKLHDLILTHYVARKWPDVIVNAVHPGWVPTKMGGSGATDDLMKGYETQVWLAAGQDPEALRTGRYLFHKKEVRQHPQATDENIQHKFISVCEQLTGLSFPV